MAVNPYDPDPFDFDPPIAKTIAPIMTPAPTVPATTIATLTPPASSNQPLSVVATPLPTTAASNNPNPFSFQNSISNSEGPSWKLRKRIVLYTLIFCALIIVYVTFKGADTRLNETITQCAFALGASTIASFVFGAVWHDSNMNK